MAVKTAEDEVDVENDEQVRHTSARCDHGCRTAIANLYDCRQCTITCVISDILVASLLRKITRGIRIAAR